MSLMNRGLVCVGRVLSRNEELVVVARAVCRGIDYMLQAKLAQEA